LGLPCNFKQKFRGRFTQLIGELSVYEELKSRGYDVALKSGQGRYDLLVNKKKVEVKACNRDNTWIKKIGANAGCAGIKPSKFDFLIYVEFDDSLEEFDFYIFSKEEAESFPFTHQEKTWYAKRYEKSESRTLNNPFDLSHFKGMSKTKATELNSLLRKSKDAWYKIE